MKKVAITLTILVSLLIAGLMYGGFYWLAIVMADPTR